MKNLKIISVVLLGSLFSGHSNADDVLIDGNIDGWIQSKATWAPNAGIASSVEDWVRNGNGYLSPGYGGQAYDAEALYAKFSGDKLYIALATGHNPLTATANGAYGAGDFALDFGKDGKYELGINFRNPNSASASDTFGVNGGVYNVSEWYYGLWQAPGVLNPSNPMKVDPTSIKAGSKLGDAEFAYSTAKTGYGTYSSDTHYFYEMSVDLNLLRQAGWDGSAFNIHWAENCANDTIILDPAQYQGQSVPEPGSLALIGLGLFGLIGWRRRARNS